MASADAEKSLKHRDVFYMRNSMGQASRMIEFLAWEALEVLPVGQEEEEEEEEKEEEPLLRPLRSTRTSLSGEAGSLDRRLL